ncbi:MAG: MBL fold metallo-hydrolase [Promethearchaeota archaeon]
MEISWLGHASFRIINSNNSIIYIDPYNIPKDEIKKADIIILTHGHYDHFDIPSIKNLRKETTIVLGPKGISSNLKKIGGKVLEFGDIYEHEGVKIELMPGYTANKSSHPKNAGGAGVIVETDNKVVYHAGDSDRIPEMKNLVSKNVNVALLPCGGKFTMDMDMASDCALDIKPKIVVPMHNWNNDLNVFKNLMNKKDPSIQVEILENKQLII